MRQAVNYAIDRNALVRLYGGLATPTENILPPTYPQYKKHTLYPLNVAKAKQLIQQAGVAGTELEVWGSNRETSKKPVEYLTDVLNKIGFKAKPKIIDAAVYWTTIGNQKTKAQIGFADWFQDYPHPLDWFDVLLNGDRITDTHNNNYSNFDNRLVNAKIAALKQKTKLDDTVNAQWAALDKQVMQAGRLGAVREPAVHRLLQHRDRHGLLHQPRSVPVRLQPDLHEVVSAARSEVI